MISKVLISAAALGGLLGYGPVMAQTVLTGTVTVNVTNTFGHSIGVTQQTCSGCTFTTAPGSIANGSTGSYVGTASSSSPVGVPIQTTVRYAATVVGQQYGCQFVAANSYGVAGSCPTNLTHTASAFAGSGGSPHCSIALTTINQTTCNAIYTATMAP